MLQFFVAFVIIMGSAMIQGITGFGFSLLAVPLLALVMPLNTIVPMLVLFSLFLNIIVFIKIKGQVDKIKIGILVVFGILSIPIGIQVLKLVDENHIKLVVGILVIISAVAMYFNYKIKFKNEKLAYGMTGLLSGILNGASSLSGPPVILMLSNEGVDKTSFRKTLATYFMVLNIFSVPMFVVSGIVTKSILLKTLKLSPAMILGVVLGIVLGDKIPEAIFRKMTLLLIFIMGILTIISSM